MLRVIIHRNIRELYGIYHHHKVFYLVRNISDFFSIVEDSTLFLLRNFVYNNL